MDGLLPVGTGVRTTRRASGDDRHGHHRPPRPGHLRPEGGEAELGYLFLRGAWGRGYAVEACTALLAWFAGACPGEPVVLCTQVANTRSLRVAAALGFTEVERFEEFDAEQWFGVWIPPAVDA